MGFQARRFAKQGKPLPEGKEERREEKISRKESTGLEAHRTFGDQATSPSSSRFP